MTKIHWHRESLDRLGVRAPKWYAEMAVGVDPISGQGGRLVRIAEAVMTGRSGVDNYPWDWFLTDAGQERAYGLLPRGSMKSLRTSGAADTLRSVKSYVADVMYVR